MKFGVSLVMRGRDATLESATTLGALAEEHGYDSIWVSDHIVIPPITKTRFPGTPDGDFPPSWREGYLESVTTLAWLASRTRRVRLGTSALVLPLRNPLVLGKQLATVDVLSGGRLSVAVTAGYAEDEFDVVGASFSDRGARLEEQVRMLQAMWQEDPASFAGEHWTFDRLNVGPLPVQRPRPPIAIGGNSPASIRRAAQLGDGWHPSAQSPAELAPKLAAFRAALDRAGRSAEDVPISVKLPFLDLVERPEKPATPAAAWIAAFEEFAAMGVGLVVIDYADETVDYALRTLEAFERDVRPRLASD